MIAPALCVGEVDKEISAKPVQILVFTDLECPFCGDLAPKLSGVAKDFNGQVQVIVKHNPLPIHPRSRAAHAAMIAAGQQGKALQMYDLLFAHQSKLSDADILDYANQLHLNLSAFKRYIAGGKAEAVIDADLAEAQALGVVGTPTLFVNGEKLVGTQSVENLKLSVRHALGNDAPDVRAIEVSRQGAFTKGPADAPITIVAFADLQCPYCAREDSILNKIAEQYPTQVRIVYKHFPLDFHQQALPAAEAVEAAGAQGKFWEMYEYLIAHQDSLDRATFDRFAKDAGFDLQRFDADMDGHVYRSRIESDRAEGVRLGVTGTPTFYVNGRTLDGARPESEFVGMVKSELARLALPSDPVGAPAAGSTKASAGETHGEFIKGNPAAPIRVEWYSDIQSSLSARAGLLMEELMRLYPERVQLVFKHRPLENRSQSWLAHEALEAAGAQGAFWPMHDLLLKNARPWAREDLEALAANLPIDHQAFSQALKEHRYLSKVQRDVDAANRAAIRGTPVFFVNGNRIDGLQPMHVFVDYVPASEKQVALSPSTQHAEGNSR